MPDWSASDKAVVDECLKKILTSAVFEHSQRQQRLLSYLVNHALEKSATPLKGYTIGIEVFDRGHEFDPSLEPIVRVEAARLRNKLREYYAGEGKHDAVVLELPKGGYYIHIAFNHADAAQAATPQQPHAHPKPRLSFAVLPFISLGIDLMSERLAEGLYADLISELSRLPGLNVVSRQSSFIYKNSAKSTVEIGDELGVHFLIEGSVQTAANRVRIDVQLVETETGGNLWAERYERTNSDPFDLQDDITRCVVTALQARFDVSAHDHFTPLGMTAHAPARRFAGESDWRIAQVTIDDARRLFQKAVIQDPSYAAAHALLSRTLLLQWCMGWGDAVGVLDRALQHAHTAMALAGHRPYSHGVQELVRQGHRCSRDAVANCHQALAQDAGNADAALFLAINLSCAGMHDEALHFLEKARSPLLYPSPFYQFALGLCHYMSGNEEASRVALKQCSELCHIAIPYEIYGAASYGLLGNKQEEAQARRELRNTLIGSDASMMIRFSPPERRDPLKRTEPIIDRRRRQEDSVH